MHATLSTRPTPAAATSRAHLALAGRLVGLPWRAGAAGPDSFNCWGLVRWWMREAHGIDMHDVAIAVDQHRTAAHAAGQLDSFVNEAADADQLRPIIAAARSGGWRPVPAGTPPAADDIVLLRHGETGLRHVGVLLLAGGHLQLLHCEGSPANPMPGVIAEPLADALQRYTQPELWKRAC